MNSMIRFKGFAFEHNPETIKITSEKNISRQSVLGAKSAVRETGDNTRIITGEGKIHGENCIYRFMKLFSLKEQNGSGILSLPGIKPFYAFFASLEFSADPTPELISYRFVFREDGSKPALFEKAERFYIIKDGEDLWDVAHRFNVPIETLAGLNPELKHVNFIEEGTRIKIC